MSLLSHKKSTDKKTVKKVLTPTKDKTLQKPLEEIRPSHVKIGNVVMHVSQAQDLVCSAIISIEEFRVAIGLPEQLLPDKTEAPVEEPLDETK